METGIGLARRLSRVARGAARRALSILTAGAGRAGYAVDARASRLPGRCTSAPAGS
ncbi:hypothetical protein JT30_5175 [Burkholderia pseudomallei]|nr:hypothetical protein JT30_5175 [Burkholderia pseudomallei]